MRKSIDIATGYRKYGLLKILKKVTGNHILIESPCT